MTRDALSRSEYRTKRKRFRRRQSFLRAGLITLVILFIVSPRHGSLRLLSNVTLGLLLLVALMTVIFEVVAGTSYFREKHRQGYKMGPFAEIHRRSNNLPSKGA